MRPALLAVAHGSPDPRHAETIEALLERVRAAAPGLAVAAGYLDHHEEGVRQAAGRLVAAGHGSVVAVPLLLTAAYHAGADLPARVAQVRSRWPGLRIRSAPVLGYDELLLDACERRLRQVGAEPDRSVPVLASAGSSAPAAAATMAQLATGLQTRGWSRPVLAYASARQPGVAAAVTGARAAGATEVAVVRCFLAPGVLPDRVAHAAAGADRITEVLGAAPELARLVLRRYGQAVAERDGTGVSGTGRRAV